ncbi:MAG: 3-hydroxyacyl-CoA dehydrogenase family protein [Planctomycetes bacterium]|nr:3-hydroxyacyl-CoA dehydrogenase family protein [Planctomycetota bacterium]
MALSNITVLGLGTMGHGIAQAFASCGYRVRGFDESQPARNSTHSRIQKNLEQFVQFDLFASDQIAPTLERISVHDSIEAACEGADFVVEAVREDLAAKQALFQQLEKCTSATTVLASNSSSFCISDSGRNLKHPERALVTHWFNPPHIVPTVEIVPSPKTNEAVVQSVVKLHRDIGKLAIVIRKELTGFLVNRVQVAVMREVWDLIDQKVVSVEDLDAAIRGSMGFRLSALGPLRIHDFGGLDIGAAVYRNLCPEIRSNTDLPQVVDDIVKDGHYGFKNGEGFYSYQGNAAEAALKQRDERYLALLKLFYKQS